VAERQFYTTDELVALKGGCFVYDVESFVNYWLVGFKNIETGKFAYFESVGNDPIQHDWLQWMADNFCLVGFNSNSYDLIVMTIAALCRGVTAADMKRATAELIEFNGTPKDVLQAHNLKWPLRCNHIDLFDVAPLTASLKTYAARLHCHTIQDLPYHPDKELTREEIAIVRTYNFNDLDNTELLLRELEPHLDLRAALSQEFGKDLRSRSDAQLAQEIICGEIERITGKPPKRRDFTKLVGSSFCYVPPPYIGFVTPAYDEILNEIRTAEIEVGSSGHVICPKTIEGRAFVIGGRRYAIGMGGLHSQEKSQALRATETMRLLDRDVTGYYPNLILKNNFSDIPGELEALQTIVNKRYAAKKAGRKAEADGLKIASNGTFGKKSDPFSPLYSPRNMVQTTLTGQLSLLMQIENLTLNGFEVVSANTDGIVTLCPQDRYAEFCSLWAAWELRTQLETEETEYQAIYSRDVNNYIVVKPDGKTKVKGVYSEVGSALNSPLSKNPQQLICVDAVIAHITKGVPLLETIQTCQRIERFCIVQKVTGGAQKDGRYLGKTVRYYYAKNVLGSIVYCKSGNKVPMSDGSKPLMTLPPSFPTDIDYGRYEETALGILEDIGFQTRRGAQLQLGGLT
jgi:hypothetical protein